MATESVAGLSPVEAFALVGVIGVGAQWLAFRLKMPAIVLMLVAGLLVGPATGLFVPARDIGDLASPMIALAVAVILFEGGLSLNFHSLRDAREGVRRLVFIGAPVGWLTATLALHYAGGLSWEVATVFGGILIVTGPTVIAPLLRQARLARRPAALLQWEAIINDPIGALAAVMAFEVVVVLNSAPGTGMDAALHLAMGIGVATVAGFVGGRLIAEGFRRALVPEYMKVPVLFAVVLAVFALSDSVLHESGLLAVTVMGLVVANAGLPSYVELRRFKEHATILLVSGVFVLLAASLHIDQLTALDWRALAAVLAVVVLARPITVFVALAGTSIPWKERLLVALTGPRGVVLVAVAGLFGVKLAELGIEDGERVGALAFAIVAFTVVVVGFGLRPLARALGLVAAETPGVLLVGGSRFNTALAKVLERVEVPSLITDTNRARLRRPRGDGVNVFYGDILSEAAENSVELMGFEQIIASSDNDAYNTLVATDLAPEFGRANVFQVARDKAERPRHALPVTLGGVGFAGGLTYDELDQRMIDGWSFRVTKLSEEYSYGDWRRKRPNAVLIGWRVGEGPLMLAPAQGDPKTKLGPNARLISLIPPETDDVAPAQPAA